MTPGGPAHCCGYHVVCCLAAGVCGQSSGWSGAVPEGGSFVSAREATPMTQSTGTRHHSPRSSGATKGELARSGAAGILALSLCSRGGRNAWAVPGHPSLPTSCCPATERALLIAISTGLGRRFSRSVLMILQHSQHSMLTHADSDLGPMIGPLASSSLWYPSMVSISPSFKEPTAKSPLLLSQGGCQVQTFTARALMPDF